MGLTPSWVKSSSIYDREQAAKVIKLIPGNPDPNNFEIDRYLQIENYLIVLVTYRGVKNYEGKKILVYEDLTWEELRKFKSLDPHFSNNKKFKSPIARFKPDISGWGMAIRFCKCMTI